MNCKNIKIKLNKQVVCKLTNKPIDFKKCTINCKNYAPKYKKDTKFSKKCAIKDNSFKKSKKLNNLERNRFSILTNDLEHCILCGQKKDNLHEVFGGRNRPNSMKYGIVIPLCVFHHQEIHKNKELQGFYHKLGQKKFMEYYPKEDFIKIFKKNYL